jgi:hypothetical protein
MFVFIATRIALAIGFYVLAGGKLIKNENIKENKTI